MTLAHRESSIPNYGLDDTSPVLTRQLYLHGMTYLLRALPSDLTPEELLSLQAAAPQPLITAHADPATHTLVPRSGKSQVAHDIPLQDPSVLHRMTATLVLQAFIFIQVVVCRVAEDPLLNSCCCAFFGRESRLSSAVSKGL
jgi:hypothetical protein